MVSLPGRPLPGSLVPPGSLAEPVAPPAAARPWLWLAAAGMLAVAFAVGLLWATQGGAVFYELVTTGLSACF
jgi:hypothetical protein